MACDNGHYRLCNCEQLLILSIYVGEALQADGIKLALKTLKAGFRTEIMISIRGTILH